MAQGKLKSDIDLSVQDVSALSSADALAAWFTHLGYDTAKRTVLTPESVGLQNQDGTFKHIELLSEDAEGFLRVVFARLRAVTAKARNDLVRVLGRLSQDHLVVLAKDFEVLEFVLIDKVKHHRPGPAAAAAYRPVPRTLTITRKAPSRLDLRILRRFTFTGRDGLEQFDKLRSTFEAAGYTGVYYQNRALFADHYLDTRLRESGAWRENPGGAFAAVQGIMADARRRFTGKDEAHAREHVYDPLFKALGFKAAQARKTDDDSPTPDYVLKDAAGNVLTAALVYRWERWLDGSDGTDEQTPDENPGAAVVSILERGDAEWVIITNGKLWRLYSRQAHSRSTNFYEVDLEEALLASGETDPNEAFRYWWLFFRPQAFAPLPTPTPGAQCWLDTVTAGSREYAKQVEGRLKKRVFEHIVPHLARGFLADRKDRLGIKGQPTADELEEIRHGTLTLLYRLLFLLYAESRDLLPIRESPYFEVSLKKIKEQAGAAAGPAESAVDEKLGAAYSAKETELYDRLSRLFGVMAEGDPALNVPTYNGGLFALEHGDAASREARIARFLTAHKVPDLYLAQAIDHLSRDPDEAKGFEMVFIDYKSLGVRQLGSIYEGLLEFRLKVADEDLTAVTEKGREKVIPLAARQGRRRAEIAVRKGEPYLADDNSERKATGSYYTPDEIVKYIVANTVGPVLDEKLEALRPLIHEAEKTFQRHVANARANPGLLPRGTDPRTFAAEKTYAQHKNLVEQLFDCRVLDPAMGSGHFLVEAVDFITDRLIVFLNRFPSNPVITALEHTRQSILESLADQGVSVDPDKLIDVHLLKRHVLKRCIHGVDLNPMAVELAKVSLWLDAFTLGTPLSFLDHHLRCGNSLIGASFEDLDKAIEGQLFAIDYEPMLRAIGNVLAIARLADATASEVRRSTDLYAAARRELSGYQIVLDILAARHFGQEEAMTLLRHAQDLDLTNRERLMAGMTAKDRKMVAAVETRAVQRSFLHWELEFPECFFGLRPGSQQEIVRKSKEEAGFDAVIGNPPYDELSEFAAGHELPEKDFFRQYSLYKDALGGRLNVFRFFILRSVSLLSSPGRHSFIVPMALLADSFTAPLRRWLLNDGLFRSVVAFPQKDDPNRRIFFDAKLSTCVYVAAKPGDSECVIGISTYPWNSFGDKPKQCTVRLSDLQRLDPDMLSLPTVDQETLGRWQQMNSFMRTTRFGEVAPCYLGEVMFNASNDDLISPKEVGPQIMRGGNVNRFCVMPVAKQGEIVFLRHQAWKKKYANDARLHHFDYPRVAFQEASPIDNWRRLIPAYMEPAHICGHTLRYFTTDSRYDLFALLACFASSLCEWRFTLTSTNNHVNAYEVDALPIPRFERMQRTAAQSAPVNWKKWDGVLATDGEEGVRRWERAVTQEMRAAPADSDAWPDTIHDALAAAGKEMTRLGEDRQQLTNDFAAWLVDELDIDEERFSGMTRLRGGQADFDEMGWHDFQDLLRRNRLACATDVEKAAVKVEKKYADAAAEVKANRARFAALDAAIDRVVWQLVGLNADGSLG